jgi:hypothetical protein
MFIGGAMSSNPASSLEHLHEQRVNVLAGLGLDFQGWNRVVCADVTARWQSHETVDALAVNVAKYLMSADQVRWLVEHHMDLGELLRGQFPDRDLNEVEQIFCQQWNQSVGTPVFGYPKRKHSGGE